MAFTLSIDDDKLLRRFHDDGVEIGVERGIVQGIEQGIERGIVQGIERGIERGIQQGIKKGRNEGETHLLRILLQQKFGPLSPYMEERLQTATQPELDRLATRILTATTIDEVMQ